MVDVHRVALSTEKRGGTRRSRSRRVVEGLRVKTRTRVTTSVVMRSVSDGDYRTFRSHPQDPTYPTYTWGPHAEDGCLARAMLYEVAGRQVADQHWAQFHHDVIKRITWDAWELPVWQIVDWLENQRREDHDA